MMNILTALTWLVPRKTYLEPYNENESQKKAAKILWNAIDKLDFSLVLFMAIITVALCYYYYFPFNEKPGRHYHPKWCGLFCLITAIFVSLFSFAVCWFVAPNPGFDIGFLMKVSAVNMVYAVFLYLIVSIIILKSGKSNAYPWI